MEPERALVHGQKSTIHNFYAKNHLHAGSPESFDGADISFPPLHMRAPTLRTRTVTRSTTLNSLEPLERRELLSDIPLTAAEICAHRESAEVQVRALVAEALQVDPVATPASSDRIGELLRANDPDMIDTLLANDCQKDIDLSRRIDLLAQEIAGTRSLLADAERSLDDSIANHDASAGRLNEIRTVIAHERSELAALADTLVQVRQHIQSLASQAQTLSGTIASERQEQTDRTNEITQSKTEQDDLRTHIAALDQRISDLTAQQQSQQRALGDTQLKENDAKKTLDTANVTLADAERTCTTATQQRDTAQTNYNTANATWQQADTAQKAAYDQWRRRPNYKNNQTLQAANKTLKTAKDAKDAAWNTLQSAQVTYQNACKTRDDAKLTRDTAKQRYDAAVSARTSAQSTLSQTESVLGNARTERQRDADRIAALDRLVAQDNDRLAQLASKIVSDQGALAQIQTESGDAQAQQHILNDQIQAATTRLDSNEDLERSAEARTDALSQEVQTQTAHVQQLQSELTQEGSDRNLLDREQTSLDAHASGIESFIHSVATEIAETLRAQALDTCRQEAETPAIPYPRMFVTADTRLDNGDQRTYPVFYVRLRSPADQTVLDIYVDGGHVARQTVGHPGGTADVTYEIRPERYSGSYYGASMEIRMFRDAVHGELLDQTSGFYNLAQPNAYMRAYQIPWEHLETGKMAPHPLVPDLRVVKTSGPNIIIHVATPSDKSFIAFENVGGLLATATLNHEGGTTFGMTMITMNGDTPSGVYNLQLMDTSAYGIIRDRVPVQWDRNTRTLTVVNPQDMWTPGADNRDPMDNAAEHPACSVGEALVQDLASEAAEYAGEQLAQAEYEKQLLLQNIDVDNPDIAQIQRSMLLQYSPFSQIDYDALYYVAHPEYRPENWETSIDRKWDEIGHSYHRGDAEHMFIEERLRSWNQYREANNAYAEALKITLEAGMNYLMGVRRGEPNRALYDQFMQTYNGQKTHDIGSSGIHFPESQAIIDAVLDIYANHIEYFIKVQGDMVALVHRAQYLETVRANAERPPRPSGYANTVLANRDRLIEAWAAMASDTTLSAEVRADASRRLVALWNTNVEQYGDAGSHAETTSNGGNPILFAALGLHFDVGDPFTDGAQGTPSELRSRIQVQSVEATAGHELISQKNVSMVPNGNSVININLPEPMMVNLFVNTPELHSIDNSLVHVAPDFALELQGTGPLVDLSYRVNRGIRSGESISTVLPAGQYTLIVRDMTNYAGLTAVQLNRLTVSNMPIHLEMRPYNTAEIIGRISIPERWDTMPVSMRVAIFDQNGNREKDLLRMPTLDPKKPVWVIIHGRNDNDTSDNIADVTKALYEFAQAHNGNYQVVTINWEEAARDNSLLPLEPLRDATWTQSVGKWVAQQLEAAGYTGQNIDFVAHSHGTYAAFFAAQEFNKTGHGKVHSIIALDPATNVQFLNGSNPINESQIIFSEVAETSLAIKASVDQQKLQNLILNASNTTSAAYYASQMIEYGSSTRTKTANKAIELIVPGEIDHDHVHGYPLTAFARIIRDSIAQGDAGAIAKSPLGLQHILNDHPAAQSMDPDRPFDGKIVAEYFQDPQKNDWWKVRPLELDLQYGTDISL